MSSKDVLVDVKNLVKTYGPLRAVNGISFQVHSGQIIGLLGPNGAGKSTTMKVLTGYIAADEGTASIAGISVDDDPVGVRRHIGYLPENAPLYNDMRVIDFLKFIGRMREVPRKKLQDRIDWSVEACGLKAKYMATIDTLSHGYRRRVGLAQAVLHDPDLLILDEPTSGLDPIQLIDIRSLILELGRTKTVLFSTHVMQEVEAVCTRVLMIRQGKLALDGTPAELKAGLTGEVKVVTRIVGASAEEIESNLKNLPATRDAHLQILAGNEYVECRISVKVSKSNDSVSDNSGDSTPLTEHIYKLAQEKNWTLRELRTEGSSLEDVFLRTAAYGQEEQPKPHDSDDQETPGASGTEPPSAATPNAPDSQEERAVKADVEQGDKR